MSKFPLRPIALISMLLVCLSLILFTNLNQKAIISIILIMLFLAIFTYIFQTQGSKNLKVFTILFTFFGLPLFLLIYLDVFNFLPIMWKIIASCILSAIFGSVFIFLIIQLDYVEIRY